MSHSCLLVLLLLHHIIVRIRWRHFMRMSQRKSCQSNICARVEMKGPPLSGRCRELAHRIARMHESASLRTRTHVRTEDGGHTHVRPAGGRSACQFDIN